MEISEIKENFWKGTQTYLQYLVNNGLGIERIAVTSIVPIEENEEFIYLIKAEKKIFDETALEFEINNKRYTESSIHIIKLDKRNNTLTVQAEKKIAHEFMGLKKEDITIIADLKFLVSRVANWYEKYGDSIRIPENAPFLSPPDKYGKHNSPSPCQIKAIETVFSQPMSYIWGAPGTGKTGFVLANSILNYLKNEDTGIILLTAPTNVALEQTLFRLLPILSENGISLNKIIRLGNPSQQFFEAYPNLCENPKLEFEISNTAAKIDALKKYKEKKEKIKTLNDKELKASLERSCETIRKIFPHCDFDNCQSELEALTVHLEELYKQTLPLKTENELSVIACTVDAYIGRCLNASLEKSKKGLSHIFLDEACYCNLAKALTLFACNCPITFLGDHMQLPPVCEIPDEELIRQEERNAFIWAQSAIYAENVFYEDMEQMYEEYIRNIPPHFDYMRKSDLNLTHRFGSGLAEVLEHHVYHNHFMSAIYTETDIVCVNVAGNYARTNRENTAEVRAAEAYINMCRPEDYVVLTPYRNQERLLSERLKKNVLTVHKSQGREWDTVILSVTDTKNKYFTDSLNPESKGLQLINTAVSRAKKRLVIICDAVYWKTQEGQLIKDLIEISDIKNGILL